MKPIASLAPAVGGLLASLALLASPAFAQTQPADLTVTMNASASTVPASATVNYTVTVNNVATYVRVCTFDPDTRQRICEPTVNSANAQGVVLRVTLPAGVTQPSAPSGDSGFTCSTSGSIVTCANGSIMAEDSAHVTVPLRMPNAGATLTVGAVASMAAAERSTTNNSAAVTTTVQPPPNPNLPDLNCSISAVNTFDGLQPVDFTMYLRNLGPVTATNASMQMFSPFTDGALNLVPAGGFSCWYVSGAKQPMTIQCDGGTIPPYGSVTMSVRLYPSITGRLPSGTAFPLTVTMDPHAAMVELSESNDSCVKSVIVSP